MDEEKCNPRLFTDFVKDAIDDPRAARGARECGALIWRWGTALFFFLQSSKLLKSIYCTVRFKIQFLLTNQTINRYQTVKNLCDKI